jgi:hypothetical protein
MANQKRITELPIINALSGSAASVIPVVVGGTTNQIPAERFSEFVNAYNATTSSNNFIGNQTITGNLVVSGDLTAERYYIETISSSVIYESGSTLFGNSGDDIHTFTGSIVLNGTTIGLGQLNAQTASQNSLNTSLGLITSSIYGEITSLNSVLLGVSSVTGAINTQILSQDLVNRRISSTTGSINTTTSSFDSVFLRISSTTGSINITTSSFDSVFLRISSTTGSINTTTSSFDLVFRGVSSVTGAMNTQTASQDLVNLGISSVTGSLIGITNGLMAFTASLDNTYATDAQLYQLYQATRSLEIQTGSQNSLNTSVGLITSSIYGEITSFNNVFSGVSAVTGAFTTTFNSIDSHILKQATQTGSQDLVNLGISSVTGSLIGITNGLMAFTAALDNTYATDVQLAAAVAGLNTQTGSQNSINSGISAVTGAFATELSGIQNNITSFDNVFGGVSAVTGAFATELGSIDSHILGISTYTSSQNVINTSVDSHILKQATQTGSQDLVNLGISTFTGSLRSEVNLIEAYTASLKGAAIVSSSQQITNYNLFAVTSSANTFYGTQTISGSLNIDAGNITILRTAGVAAVTLESTATNGEATLTLTGKNSSGTVRSSILKYDNLDVLRLGTASPIPIRFETNDVGRLTIASGDLGGDGSVTVNTGNLVIGTTGKGIDFSITSNGSGTTTSELLNDYEEGTFTATLKGSISDPTTPVTTTGYYTKVGNKVTIWVEFASVDTTGASGEVFVQGLPFTSSTNCKSPGGVVTFNLNFNSAEYLTAFMTANGTSFELLGARSSSTWTVATHTASANVYLVATITYFV